MKIRADAQFLDQLIKFKDEGLNEEIACIIGRLRTAFGPDPDSTLGVSAD